jgi:hypothetical protein
MSVSLISIIKTLFFHLVSYYSFPKISLRVHITFSRQAYSKKSPMYGDSGSHRMLKIYSNNFLIVM